VGDLVHADDGLVLGPGITAREPAGAAKRTATPNAAADRTNPDKDIAEALPALMSKTLAAPGAAGPCFAQRRLEVVIEDRPPRKACDINKLPENPSAPSSQPPERTMC